jgi:hypothetical protein
MAKLIPSYPKILTLGSVYTERALTGEVVIQEKIDGSQFSFGLNEDNELIMRTHHSQIVFGNVPKMFQSAVDYLLSIENKIKERYSPDTYFYCEYLQKPKHNTLSYDKIPLNHLVLYDILEYNQWGSIDMLALAARILDIDLVPELCRGETNKEQLQEFLNTDSYLGKEKIEGVVIKNYSEHILIGGNVYPLFTKFVQKSFKERNSKEWSKDKDELKEYLESFNNTARWQKAIIHADELGCLTHTPKDIGMLIKNINQDVIDEEEENIKRYLFKYYWKNISHNCTRGFAEWYKLQLLERIEED